MHKGFFTTATILGGLAVALGAFGAHALKTLVPALAVNTFETGVRYQFYHVFALALTGMLYNSYTNKWLKWAGRSFIIGIILFSGSLYVLTLLTAIDQPSLRWIGAITPLGGVAFIAGWIFLFVGVSSTPAKVAD